MYEGVEKSMLEGDPLRRKVVESKHGQNLTLFESTCELSGNLTCPALFSAIGHNDPSVARGPGYCQHWGTELNRHLQLVESCCLHGNVM